MNKKLYLVGKLINFDTKSWEFAGIFSTEEIAVKNCFNEDYFLAEITIDEEIPQDSQKFDYAYYPHLEAKPIRTFLI